MTEKRFELTFMDCFYITDHQTKDYASVLEEDLEEIVDLLNDLVDENEELKQRNDRQAKQLDRLYHLVEEKDWRTLTDILDDFKRCEEQLQKEWKCYE